MQMTTCLYIILLGISLRRWVRSLDTRIEIYELEWYDTCPGRTWSGVQISPDPPFNSNFSTAL